MEIWREEGVFNLIILLTVSDDGLSIICQIYDKYHRLMIKTATEILGSSRGEDAAHDVFVKIIEKFENKFEELCDKPGQFFVILVRNHSLNLKNKDKVELVELGEDMEADGIIFQSNESPEDILSRQDSYERLIALIRLLKPDTRQILENKYILGYTNKEIAEMMSISQTLVSTRLSRAKKKLYEMYATAEER